MAWITANADTIWLVFTSIVTLASVLASLTPNRKDDKVLTAMSKAVDVIALNWGFAKRKNEKTEKSE